VRQYLRMFAAMIMIMMASSVVAHAEQIDYNPAKVSDSLKAIRLLRSLLPHYTSQTVFERADQIIKNRSLAGGENHVRGHSS